LCSTLENGLKKMRFDIQFQNFVFQKVLLRPKFLKKYCVSPFHKELIIFANFELDFQQRV
jgi:hypothetical protein